MNKKNISIAVGVILIAVIVVLLVLFNTKKNVEFDTKGGTEVKTQEVKFFRKAERPADPVREGYTFAGWYYEDLKFDFDTKITKNMTIEARWTEGEEEGTHTITFNSNGGSSVASVKVKENGTITKPSNPTRSGYKFVSWQVDGKDFDFKTKVTKNLVLTAKWEKEDEQPSGGEKTPKLSSGNFTLNVGGSKKLSMQNTSGKVTWKSSNTKVATVDANGNVKAIGEGTATITATVDGKDYTVRVTVKKKSEGGSTTPTEPTNPDTPVDPKPEEPKHTYTAACVKVADSSVDQCKITITDETGASVNGTVTITSTTGATQTVPTGTLKPSSLIAGLKVASTN